MQRMNFFISISIFTTKRIEMCSYFGIVSDGFRSQNVVCLFHYTKIYSDFVGKTYFFMGCLLPMLWLLGGYLS